MRKTPDSPSFEAVSAELRARHGGNLRVLEGKPDRRRISTGIFQIDRVLGGGLPVNRISLIRGRKGSYKTTVALKTIGNYLKSCVHCLTPTDYCRCGKTESHDRICVFIDTEQALDEGYVMRLGIDPRRITLFQPAYGELACEYAEKFARLPEVGAIIIDSLAALIPNAQLENSYLDGLSRGARAKLINRMCQGMVGSLNRDDQGFPKIAVFINHVLDKIDGGMYAGDYSPGGDGQSYYSSVVLKIWAREKNKAKQDETETMELGRKQGLGFLLEHSKVSRSNVPGEAEIYIDPEPGDAWRYGDSNDVVALADWASRIGLIEKDVDSYMYRDKKYGKKALENYFAKHRDEYFTLRDEVIRGTFRDQ